MNDNDQSGDFVIPRIVNVTADARDLALAYLNSVRMQFPDKNWIVSFDWADLRRVRFPRNSNNWQDLGPGLDIGAYERHKIPKSAIQANGNFEFFVNIDNPTLAAAKLKLIDVDRSVTPPKLILR